MTRKIVPAPCLDRVHALQIDGFRSRSTHPACLVPRKSEGVAGADVTAGRPRLERRSDRQPKVLLVLTGGIHTRCRTSRMVSVACPHFRWSSKGRYWECARLRRPLRLASDVKDGRDRQRLFELIGGRGRATVTLGVGERAPKSQRLLFTCREEQSNQKSERKHGDTCSIINRDPSTDTKHGSRSDDVRKATRCRPLTRFGGVRVLGDPGAGNVLAGRCEPGQAIRLVTLAEDIPRRHKHRASTA